MDPEAFLLLAKSILSDEPARCRCAIGRAYYAAFNIAAQILRSNQCPIPENATAHGDIINHLRWSDNRDLMDTAIKIGDLKNKRNRADYQMGNQPAVETKRNAQLQIEIAERAIKSLREGFADQNKSLILAAINKNRNAATGRAS